MIWRCAGIIGVHPGAFTLRELIGMAEARQHDLWNYASAMMALSANLHRNPKKGRALRPSDFHPFARFSRSEKPIPAGISVLKSIFVDPPGRRK